MVDVVFICATKDSSIFTANPAYSPPALVLSLLAIPGLLWLGNPAVALLTGMILMLVINTPLLPHSGVIGKFALQGAIVLLGLKLNMSDLWRINADYTLYVAIYVLSAIGLGLVAGKLLRVDATSSALMASGTGICGGTTIVTLAPILKAGAEQMGAALAIVFLLNAVALFAFPLLGEYLQLSQTQFGVWVALAVHDTSSVVATASLYGEEAAKVATTVKLGRTLWLIPLVLVASLMTGRREVKLRIPGFILLFIAASILGSVLSLPAAVPAIAGLASQSLLIVALFLVGTEIDRATLRRLRGRVLAQALLLWVMVVPATLALVMWVVT